MTATHQYGQERFLLSEELVSKIIALGQEEDATPFMTLLTGFNVLLHRYSGQDDICVGAPLAAQAMVLRTDLSGRPTFREALRRTQTVVLEAQSHHSSRPDLDVRLLRVMFGFAPPAPPPIVVEKFDVFLMLTHEQGSVAGVLTYRQDLFDPTTIERMVQHQVRLLGDVVVNPDHPIGELELLTPAERRQLLIEWNDTPKERPGDTCLHQLFEAHVERTPDAVAVVFGSQKVSYHELNRRANRLANHLRKLGVARGSMVGLYVDRSVEMVVGILGVMKAGGAYVPLDPVYPADRVAFVLEDTRAPVLLTQEPLLDKVLANAAKVVCLDRDWPHIEQCSDDPPPLLPSSGKDIAYVIYTSGSTGRPKGVQIPHQNVVRLLTATESWFGFTPRDVWTFFHSHAFDFSVWELWGALGYGGSVVMISYAVSRSTDDFLELLRAERVTVLNQTPSAFRLLVAADERSRANEPLSLRAVIFGGEALELASLRPWVNRHGDHLPQLINMYGITETTVHVTYRRLTAADIGSPKGSVIGKPIPDLQLYVLDPYLNPVPIGVIGEIYVGGEGLARGYLNRPELTAERFIPNPFSERGSERLYKTGDLARRLPDGDLESLGRRDFQVKIRGFRIELGEIEAALLSQPAVREASVLAREHVPGDTRLVAYVVPKGGAPATEELRAALRRSLPEYMVPAAFVMLSALPLTPNGKVDRKALPEPAWGADANTYVAPRSALETSLTRLWCDLLGVESLGVDDNFFEHGGQSLIATALLARVRDAFDVNLPMRVLFELPTITGMAGELLARADDRERVERAARALMTVTSATPENSAHRGELGLGQESRGLRDAMVRATGTTVQTIPRRATSNGDAPMSSGQQSLYFVEQTFTGTGPRPYNEVYAVDVRGALDHGRLQQAMNEVVKRHQALRTTFHAVGTTLVQRVAAPYEPQLNIRDLGAGANNRRSAEVSRAAFDEVRKPFDLEHGPLMRATVLKFGPADQVLLITMHHIAVDDWSLQLFCSDLGTAYAAHGALDRRDELPEYTDYAELEQDWLKSEEAHAQLSFWTGLLDTAPHSLELPFDRPRPKVLTSEGARREFKIPRDVEDALARIALQEHASLFMALLAVFGAQLGGYARQEALLVGCPISNRRRPGVQDMMGYFTNTMPVPVNLRGAPTFRELIRRVRDVSLDVHANQELPLAHLLRARRFRRDGNRNPLFQVYFALQHKPALKIPDATVDLTLPAAGRALFELSLDVTPEPDGLGAVLEYATELFSAERVAKIEADFLALAHVAAASPDRPFALSLDGPDKRTV